VRLGSPVDGAQAVARSAAALVAPAVFGIALWSVICELARERHARLAGLHPGVADLLPKGVSLGAHHRAWSRCNASHVTNRDELAELLSESSPFLAPDGQPSVDQLWERLLLSPRCTVQVVDAEDPQVRFGYFVVYPVLSETVRRIRAGEITADRQLKPTDLAGSAEAAAGWFIGVIWATGPRWMRRCVLATLVDSLAASQAGDVRRPVFARPYNQKGRSLMQKYRLAPIGEQADAIWVTPQ
jgi:hypothetical protein